MEAEKLPTPIKFEKWCAWNAAPCEKSSEAQIERLQEKIQELEAMLESVGAGGVSAQRVTQGAPVMEYVRGDVLPAVGSRVFIRHGRDDDAHACTVTGYYALGDHRGNKHLHRVFVRMVYEGTNTEQARALCGRYPSVEAALAATTTTPAPMMLPEPVAAQEPFGYFKAEPFGWRDCAETDEGAIALYEAPQPQADAGDAGRYLDYLIHNQARVLNNLDEYEGDEDDVDCGYWLEWTDDKSQVWVQIGVFKTPRDAIEAAIAAAEEMK